MRLQTYNLVCKRKQVKDNNLRNKRVGANKYNMVSNTYK